MNHWKALETSLPDTLTGAEVLARARAQVRIVAAEAGEFVEEFRISLTTNRTVGCKTWGVCYRPGTPALDLIIERPSPQSGS